MHRPRVRVLYVVCECHATRMLYVMWPCRSAAPEPRHCCQVSLRWAADGNGRHHSVADGPSREVCERVRMRECAISPLPRHGGGCSRMHDHTGCAYFLPFSWGLDRACIARPSHMCRGTGPTSATRTWTGLALPRMQGAPTLRLPAAAMGARWRDRGHSAALPDRDAEGDPHPGWFLMGLRTKARLGWARLG